MDGRGPVWLAAIPSDARRGKWCGSLFGMCNDRKEQWHQWRFVKDLGFLIWRTGGGIYRGLVLRRGVDFMRAWIGWLGRWTRWELLATYLLEPHPSDLSSLRVFDLFAYGGLGVRRPSLLAGSDIAFWNAFTLQVSTILLRSKCSVHIAVQGPSLPQ